MSWNWTLTTDGRQVVFGDDDALVVVDKWSASAGKLRIDDHENPRGDGLRFGSDYRSGQVVDFSMWVNGGDEETARAGLASVQAAWRNDVSRRRGGSMCRLEHPRGRAAFGRPRGFSADTQRIEQGWATIKADFEAVDDLWYGPEEVTTIRFVPEFTGGLPIPAAVPWVLGGGSGESSYMVTVGGDVAAWPVFELHGPIADPFIEVVGVGRLVFRGQLAYDQTLTVDTRHWARWVKRDGAAFPGALSPAGSRLSDMSMRPGSYQVFFGGHDPTGSSSLDVRVSPAFTSF